MHVLFVHQNFPAQFGHIARHLISTAAGSARFVSKTPPGEVDGIQKIAVQDHQAAPARRPTIAAGRSRTPIWHAHGVFEACKAHPELRPDLIVGHSGFGSTLFLPELYPDVPIINYFEYLLSPARLRHGFPPRVPPGGDRLPPRAGAERDAPARPGQLPLGLQPDALSARAVPRRATAQDRRHLRRHRDRPLPSPRRRPPSRRRSRSSTHRPGSSPTSAAASSRCAGSTSS